MRAVLIICVMFLNSCAGYIDNEKVVCKNGMPGYITCETTNIAQEEHLTIPPSPIPVITLP